MSDGAARLVSLVEFLRRRAAIADKFAIHHAYAPAQELAGGILVGDDCAAIPDAGGYLLFAAEGMLESFVAADPWFAGYSAVMVNLSDVAAMGGKPIAVVDVLWTAGLERSSQVWQGMAAASRKYGVPIVGGHTTITGAGSSSYLAAAVLGRAEHLITSFDARPSDELVMAVDLRGNYRGDKPFWNASVGAPGERLRGDLALLPELAATGWCHAGKDISNGGIPGTLAMLLHCSQMGAELNLERIPMPEGIDLERWLVSFPSYGYLLSVPPENVARVIPHFAERGIACASIGRVTEEPGIILSLAGARQAFEPVH
jgi:hypothetical protein